MTLHGKSKRIRLGILLAFICGVFMRGVFQPLMFSQILGVVVGLLPFSMYLSTFPPQIL